MNVYMTVLARNEEACKKYAVYMIYREYNMTIINAFDNLKCEMRINSIIAIAPTLIGLTPAWLSNGKYCMFIRTKKANATFFSV